MLALLILLGAPPAITDAPDPAVATRIIEAARASDRAWTRLEALCDDIGHRLSGSEALARAVQWAHAELKADGQEGLRLQAVSVPRWVRGAESLEMLAPMAAPLPMLGLGWSSGTPPEGITAEVLVARDEAAFEALGERVRGRIVLFDNPMPAWHPEKGTGYGEAVRFRIKGAGMVAEKGGLAALVRSVTAHSLRTPHTGTQSYKDGVSAVPAAAITTEDADRISRLVARGKTVKVRLKMAARLDGEVESHNVIAELRGRERPEEIVVIGGHLDSWDVGQGAHDDGAGVVMAIEVLRILRSLKLRPRRTLRAVLWTNEENGLRGARAYAESADLARHVAAIEADLGAFAPTGYNAQHHDEAAAARMVERMKAAVPALTPLKATRMAVGFSGVDLQPLKAAGVPLLGHRTHSQRYFDIHHTAADTLDKVDPAELKDNVAALAIMAWWLAERPGRLDAP